MRIQHKSHFESMLHLPAGGHLPGAHHPHCDRYNHHLLWVRGYPLCLGCVCMYSGMIIGLPLVFLVSWQWFSLSNWVALHCVLLIPTLLQIRLQTKGFKIFSRLVLGICITSYWAGGVLFFQPPFNIWVFRISLAVVFLVLYNLLSQVRNRYEDDPCSTCPLGTYPTCEWNLPRILNETQDPILEQALRGGEAVATDLKST